MGYVPLEWHSYIRHLRFLKRFYEKLGKCKQEQGLTLEEAVLYDKLAVIVPTFEPLLGLVGGAS
jgi:hypothetical protein